MTRRLLIASIGGALTLCEGSVLAQSTFECPKARAQLRSAEPIIGQLEEPRGELHESDLTAKKGGLYELRFNLARTTDTQLEKWLVCHYQDDSEQVVKLLPTTKECIIVSKNQGVDPQTKATHYRILSVTCK